MSAKAAPKVTLFVLILMLTGCVFLPSVSRQQSSAGCELVTRELDLAVVEGGDVFRHTYEVNAGCVNEACLVVLAGLITVPVGSLIISGSVVLVGNTLHWFEVQGRCEDGLVKSVGRDLTALIGQK
ncbi:MAG: hypothetical protein ACPG4N_05030 [Gammaproteobacteria bacterium]